MMAHLASLRDKGRGYARLMNDDLRAKVAADLPRLTELLGDLVGLPSVSAPGFDKAKVHEAAENDRRDTSSGPGSRTPSSWRRTVATRRCSPRSPRQKVLPHFFSTPTTTSSLRAHPTSGPPIRSSLSSAKAGYMEGARPTTRVG